SQPGRPSRSRRAPSTTRRRRAPRRRARPGPRATSCDRAFASRPLSRCLKLPLLTSILPWRRLRIPAWERINTMLPNATRRPMATPRGRAPPFRGPPTPRRLPDADRDEAPRGDAREDAVSRLAGPHEDDDEVSGPQLERRKHLEGDCRPAVAAGGHRGG